MPPRKLTPPLVVATAIEVADSQGIERLTMRGLARALGVEAMSLYHHYPNKDALLDAMIDQVYAEIVLPSATGEWIDELRQRSHSVRDVLNRHRWALPLMESRHRPGPANLAYHDATIACLRGADFSPAQAAHAYAILDAFVYGFVLQEATLPFDDGPEAAQMLSEEPYEEAMATYPNLAWLAQNVVLAEGYNFANEFGPGLDLVLSAIANLGS